MVLPTRKLKITLLTLCLWFALGGPAAYGWQNSVRSALALLPAGDQPIALVAEVMCDPHGDISLASAQNGPFRPLEPDMTTTAACHGYWARFTLHASEVAPGGWVLQLSRDWEYADLYLEQDGVSRVEQSGAVQAPQFRAVPSGDIAFLLTMNGGATVTAYLHVVGDTTRFGESGALGGTIQPLHRWILQQRSLLFAQGIYAGIILALALYNLILYLAIRERAYLYYVLYVVSFGALWSERSGFFFQFLWPHHHLWEWSLQPYLAASAIIFSVLFVRKFLSTREHSRLADSALTAIAALTLLLVLATVIDARVPLPLPLALIGLTVTIFYAIMGIIALRRGYRPARFFLVAWTALLAGNVIYILMFLRILPMTFVTYYSAQTGSALEGILLAFALADRVNLLKGQKEEKQQQYTRELQQKVQERTAALNDAVQKLQTASATDPLTGLSNRRHVESTIQPWIAELQRQRVRDLPDAQWRYLAICLADLDHFKLINDDLGHATGDRVLRAAANILQQNVRATAILSRWGGEEFLILDHVTGPQEDLLMAERLRLSLLQESALEVLKTTLPLSLSLGVVRYPFSDSFPNLLDWDHCLALADHALYRAKRTGRNRWQCYRPNEDVLRATVKSLGMEEVRRLLRLHGDEAFSLGLIAVVEQISSDVVL